MQPNNSNAFGDAPVQDTVSNVEADTAAKVPGKTNAFGDSAVGTPTPSQAALINPEGIGPGPFTMSNLYQGAKSAAIGATKGAANLLDMTIGPTLHDIRGDLPTFNDVATRYLPEPENKPAANITEGATTGALFGPAGALMGGASAAGTEVLNRLSPDTPIRNMAIPAAASAVLTPSTVNQLLRFGRLAGEGLGAIERSPLVQAKMDQGITTGTAASSTPSDFWRKMQRSIRETLFGGNKINDVQKAEQGQLETAVNKQADTLGPDVTKQQAGQGLQEGINDGVTQVKQLFRQREEALDQVMPPDNTFVNMRPYADKLRGDFTPELGAENQLAAQGNTPISRYVEPMEQDLIAASGPTNATGQPVFSNNALSVSAIRQVKQNIGDKLTESLLNGDASARQLKIVYGTLADAQGSAYAGTPYEKFYNELKTAEHEMYSSIEAFADPLVKQGVKPESIAQLLMSDMKLGDSRLSAALNLIPAGMKDQYSGLVLRNIGKSPNGDFDPNRFFNNWQRISPEAKATLFGDANKDIPKAYDQLALIAQNQARGAKAANPSQTAGTSEVYHLFTMFGGALGGIAGYEASHISNNADYEGKGALGGAAAGALLMSTAGYGAMSRLMTNPGFIRWLATPVAFDKVPAHIRALSAVAGETPEIKDAAKVFQSFASQKLPQQKHGEEHGFLGGGFVDFPDQTPTAYAKGGKVDPNSPYNPFSRETSNYADGGYIEPPSKELQDKHEKTYPKKNTPELHIKNFPKENDYIEPPAADNKNPPEANRYASGGAANDNPVSILQMAIGPYSTLFGNHLNFVLNKSSGSPAGALWSSSAISHPPASNDNSRGYAQGGISHNTNDPKAFYNPDPPVNNTDIQGGGWAEGGAVGTSDRSSLLSKIIQYESGGKNVMNYINDKTHTAGGYYQITNTNWRAYAPEVGIDLSKYPSAISAPEQLQTKVANLLIDKFGTKPWKLTMETSNDTSKSVPRDINKPQTLLAQILPTVDTTSEAPPETPFRDEIAAVNANPAFEPTTRYVANKILSETP